MKTKLFITLAFLATFILGGAAGYFAARNSGFPSEQAIERERPERLSGQDRQLRALRTRMIEELQLTREQEEPFFSLIGDHRRDVREVMDAQRMEIDRIMAARSDSLRRSLAEILTAEQLQKWDEMYSRPALRERQRRQRREGWRR